MQDILDFDPTRSILKNLQRANIARAILLSLVIMGFVQLISHCAEYNMLEKFRDGTISYREQKWNGMRQTIIAVIRFILTIICMVFFIMWFRRAFHNLHKLGVKELSASEGWASGAWFIPIFNLYRPYQLMMEIWDKTISTVGKVIDTRYERTNPAIVGWWWFFWLSKVVLGIIIAMMPRQSADIDTLQSRDMVLLFYAVCEMSAGIFAMIMIKRCSYFETELFQHQEEVVRQLKLEEEKDEQKGTMEEESETKITIS